MERITKTGTGRVSIDIIYFDEKAGGAEIIVETQRLNAKELAVEIADAQDKKQNWLVFSQSDKDVEVAKCDEQLQRLENIRTIMDT